MISRLNLIDVPASTPDYADYILLDSGGTAITTGQTDRVAMQTTPTGATVAVEYELPDDLEAGTYQIVFTLEGTSDRYNVEYTVASGARDNDGYITLDGSLNLTVPMDTGTWQLFQYDSLAYEGNIDGGRIEAPDLRSPTTLDSYMLVATNDAGEIFDVEVFSISPMVLKAIRELRSRIDRLQRQLRLDALQFEDIDYLRALVRGRDRVNAMPPMTNVSMTGATGPIRSIWLLASEIEALRTRYLEEGLTSYQYDGANVNLTVEVQDVIQNVVQQLEDRLNNEGTRIKTDMHRRGMTAGNGFWAMGSAAPGALGTSLGPVSGLGPRIRSHPYGRMPFKF